MILVVKDTRIQIQMIARFVSITPPPAVVVAAMQFCVVVAVPQCDQVSHCFTYSVVVSCHGTGLYKEAKCAASSCYSCVKKQNQKERNLGYMSLINC